MFVGSDQEDCRLSAGSPCIDSSDTSALPADVTTDLDGNTRVINASVDMGSYESQEIVIPSWKALRPDGTCFEGEGIEPDIHVEVKDGDLNSRDPILERALEYLRS